MGNEREVHCWEDKRENTGEFDGWWPIERSYSCMLLQGHSGDHEFTLDTEIIITFADTGAKD